MILRTAATRRLALIFPVACMLLAAGCAATGPAFSGLAPVENGQSQVYVYRTKANGYMASYNLLANGQLVGSLKTEGWQRVSLTPGSHTIEIERGLNRERKARGIDLAPGETKFLRVWDGVVGGGVAVLPGGAAYGTGTAVFGLEDVSCESALQELTVLKQSN